MRGAGVQSELAQRITDMGKLITEARVASPPRAAATHPSRQQLAHLILARVQIHEELSILRQRADHVTEEANHIVLKAIAEQSREIVAYSRDNTRVQFILTHM